jgi:DoxX-like protein
MLTSLSLVLAAACLIPAAAKLSSQPRMLASATHFGIAWQRYQLIGVAELGAAIGILAGLVWRPIGLIAGMCLAALLLAAVLTHVRAGDRGRELMPALLILALDAMYWSQLWVSAS